jgi:hypothetical protein
MKELECFEFRHCLTNVTKTYPYAESCEGEILYCVYSNLIYCLQTLSESHRRQERLDQVASTEQIHHLFRFKLKVSTNYMRTLHSPASCDRGSDSKISPPLLQLLVFSDKHLVNKIVYYLAPRSLYDISMIGNPF